MAVVTKGPVAMAGSMLTRANSMGTKDPTRAATDMEQSTALQTAMASMKVLKLNWATAPMKSP